MSYNSELVSALRQAGKPGSAKENDELAAKVLEGDTAARERMISGNTSMVISLVDKFTRRRPDAAFFRDDLCSAGFLALVKAVCRLAMKPHVNPTGLMSKYVRGAIADAWESEAGLGPPRTRHRRRKQGRAVVRIVPLSDDDGATIIDRVVDPRTMPDLIDEIESCCYTEEDKEIVDLLAEGYTDKEVGTTLDIPRSTVAERRKAIEARFNRKTKTINKQPAAQP